MTDPGSTAPVPPDAPSSTLPDARPEAGGRRPLMALAWLWVGAPFAYGVYELLLKLRLLFTG
ncbi:MFS transporter small subunit [Streptomyces xinghaiensis]|uniref:MFS transporter small subunit n=1 Tax=Streptomyces xinghaiensis TaxID=1038928 RepID=UPI00342B9E1A